MRKSAVLCEWKGLMLLTLGGCVTIACGDDAAGNTALTGGAPTSGGTPSTGGTSWTGGTPALGGVPTETGGFLSTGASAGLGGSAAGGIGVTGGSPASGGASTGGVAGAAARDAVGGEAGHPTSAGSGGAAMDFGAAPFDEPGRVEVGVMNGCPMPLWIRGAGSGAVLEPDLAELGPGEVRWYSAPESWAAARVTAYVDGPGQGEIEKVEMTFSPAGDGVVLNTNITYVDWLGLPVEIEGVGSGAACEKVGCYLPRNEVLSGCPDGLLSGDRCVAARSYCLEPANQGTEYCHQLDAEIARCASTKPGCEGAAGAKTPEVYACNGAFFSQSPKWCAALNRGMLDSPDSPDRGLYYSQPPYNTYSKWVHQVCPGIYAFPYDDYPSNVDESGFRACTQGRELRITFCPAG